MLVAIGGAQLGNRRVQRSVLVHVDDQLERWRLVAAARHRRYSFADRKLRMVVVCVQNSYIESPFIDGGCGFNVFCIFFCSEKQKMRLLVEI